MSELGERVLRLKGYPREAEPEPLVVSEEIKRSQDLVERVRLRKLAAEETDLDRLEKEFLLLVIEKLRGR